MLILTVMRLLMLMHVVCSGASATSLPTTGLKTFGIGKSAFRIRSQETQIYSQSGEVPKMGFLKINEQQKHVAGKITEFSFENCFSRTHQHILRA